MCKGRLLKAQRELKYLGILDDKYLFGRHKAMTVNKAEARLEALSRLMSNIDGPQTKKL